MNTFKVYPRRLKNPKWRIPISWYIWRLFGMVLARINRGERAGQILVLGEKYPEKKPNAIVWIWNVYNPAWFYAKYLMHSPTEEDFAQQHEMKKWAIFIYEI